MAMNECGAFKTDVNQHAFTHMKQGKQGKLILLLKINFYR